LDTPIPKTTLLLHIVFYTTLEDALDHPCNFLNKALKVGRRKWVSYALAISIVEAWPT
jgi:hypothetical protein